MLKRIFPFVLVLAGCSSPRAETPPPEWIVGAYRYSASGTFAKKFPWQAKADMMLEKDGQYTLDFTVHIDDDNGGDTDNEESYGSYYVESNRLILDSANDNQDSKVLEIQGDSLVPKIGWPVRLALKGFRIPDPVFVKTP